MVEGLDGIGQDMEPPARGRGRRGAALAAGATWGRKLMQAEDIALNDPALLPAFFWTDPNIVWPYVEGWRSNGMDKHRSRWISIDQAARIKQFS